MKIQCDVCNKEEATVFCTADEAALCDACDHRVHHANKLASKHQRFTLLHPCSSSKQVPLCDICQEKRAFLFCQQDRAILCRDCDVPIHSANEHTQRHNRFLLTGVKLSSRSATYNTSSSSSNGGDSVPEFKVDNPISSISAPNFNPSSNEVDGSTSSISEYLIEMLPGWHVEDLLDSSPSLSPFGFCKNDDGMLPFFDPAQSLYHLPQMEGPIGFKETTMKGNKRWTNDAFTVPQINPPPTVVTKRSRPF
ncbi:B-box zinc finger protein 21-like [Gossypium australe]|uniref:B-box zinc finger protein 21-like n=1 Tax=Gossypium australe TaxID=47621 RepID=A0A5B6W4N0_9ROSI|nr:B-box zinc finger protein 21-like [Gossypium australe]